MKELNKFRKFLNENLNEGLFDDFKKELGDVLKKAQEMDKALRTGGGGGGQSKAAQKAAQDRQLKADAKKAGVDFKEEQVHEGTWSMGGPKDIDSIISGLQGLIKMADDAQNKKNAAGRGFVNALQNQLKSEGWNARMYRIVGDDSFFDHYDAANSAAAMRDFDRVKNHLGDAIARAEELKAAIMNDSVLDEIIGEEKEEVNEAPAVFDEIDEMIETLAVHMSAEDVLKELMSELQIVPGGTKTLHSALKNIMIDADLMETKNEEE